MSRVEPAGQFESDRQRLLAASQLRPENFDEFQRLCLTLAHGSAFQFVLVELEDERLRPPLIAQLDAVLSSRQIKATSLQLGDDIDSISALEARLLALTAAHEVIHLIGGNQWFSPERWAEFNTRRDALAAACRSRLVFWLSPALVRACATHALDWWAWRSGVYAFDTPAQPVAHPDPQFAPAFSRLSQAERARRIAQLRAWLDESPPTQLLPPLLDELASLLESLGQFDEALRIYREEALPVYEKLGDVRARAVTLGKIAHVLRERGELDEALHIYRGEALPVFEKLGDVHARAMTLGQIADVLRARGELDEALHIYREEALPVFEKLGDVHARAVCLGKIADVLSARGELDEALRIYREEALPVYEKLGDVRARAVTLGKIADVLRARGELDEALRIRREDELPVYEKLGDVRERAVCLGRIADVLMARGELDEALRIRREDELPVYEKLGDVRSRAVTLGQIADVLMARGELDEALRIRREDELPVYEKLGDVHALLVGRANLAVDLLRRGREADRPEIAHLLALALEAAERLQIPEAEQIRNLRRQFSG